VERSLVLIKPDAMHTGLGGAIISRLEKLGLRIIGLKMLHMDRGMAEDHYAVHREKPFFQALVEFMTSAPIMAMVFEGEGAVEKIRREMGATDPAKAERGTIRAEFGQDVQRNAVHGSDSPETAEKEIRLFFREEELFSPRGG
jgi:nucleoside-diphosphate kinase